MKKFALILCMLALGTPGWADPERLSSQYYQQCSNLKNTATALEMWAHDNHGQYPTNLSELTPNYLKHLLPGPQGRVEEIIYLVDPSGRNYQLKVGGDSFRQLQVASNYPQYTSERGLMLNENGELPQLPLHLFSPQLDPSWKAGQRKPGLSWTRGSETIFSSLCLNQVESEAERSYLHGFYGGVESIEGERTGAAGGRVKLVRGSHLVQNVRINYLELRSLKEDTLRVLHYETEAEQADPAVVQEFQRMLADL